MQQLSRGDPLVYAADYSRVHSYFFQDHKTIEARLAVNQTTQTLTDFIGKHNLPLWLS